MPTLVTLTEDELAGMSLSDLASLSLGEVEAWLISRGATGVGYNPHRFVELFGGSIVEVTAFEPDPNTFRGYYYYNATSNKLFRKIKISNPSTGVSVYRWQPCSE